MSTFIRLVDYSADFSSEQYSVDFHVLTEFQRPSPVSCDFYIKIKLISLNLTTFFYWILADFPPNSRSTGRLFGGNGSIVTCLMQISSIKVIRRVLLVKIVQFHAISADQRTIQSISAEQSTGGNWKLERSSLVPLDFDLPFDVILTNFDTSDPIEPLWITNEGCFREIAVHSNRRNVETDSISIKCYRLATKR